MANYASAVRRIRRSEKSRQCNKHHTSVMKTFIKKVLSSDNKEEAQQLFNQTQKTLDKLVAKGVIHKNKAANKKSKLALHLNRLS